MNHKLVFAILLCTACSVSTPAPAPSTAHTSVDGTFAHYTMSPRGDVDGVTLDDGTLVHFPPHTFVGAKVALAAGDKVHVEGDLTSERGPRVIGRATVKKGDVVIATDDGNPPPPPPGPRGPRADLPAVTRDGTVARLLINPHGDSDGVVLDDGAVVRFPPSPSANVSVGATIHAVGHGSAKFVHADSLALATGAAIPLGPAAGAPPPQPPVPLATTNASGVIAQILKNPEDNPDMLVLRDGTLVRVPPPLTDGAGDALKVGATVQIEGEGGTYSGRKSMHARRLTVDGHSFSDPGPQGAPPPPPPVAP